MADRDLADACLRHPFVQGLANGSLPPWRYKEYVAQDAFFLRAFVDAYELAGQQAKDEAGRSLYDELAAGVEEELSLHRSMAQRLGIDLASVAPSPATLAYTDFFARDGGDAARALRGGCDAAVFAALRVVGTAVTAVAG